RLQHEIGKLAWMAPEGKRHYVVEFVVADPGRIDPSLLHQLLLHSVAVARGRAHGLRVAGFANGAVDRVLVHVRIERDATMRRLEARSVLWIFRGGAERRGLARRLRHHSSRGSGRRRLALRRWRRVGTACDPKHRHHQTGTVSPISHRGRMPYV